MRKYVFNTRLLGAVFSGWSSVQATRKGKRDWKLALMWVSWGIGVAVAVGTVIDEAREREIEAAKFDLEWNDE